MTGSSSTASTWGTAACTDAWGEELSLTWVFTAANCSGPGGAIVTGVTPRSFACKLHAIATGWNGRLDKDPHRSPQIVVIDDDAIMRDLMTDWLEAAGYRVHKAAD